MDYFIIPVLSWALIPELSRAQTSSLCNRQGSGSLFPGDARTGYHRHFILAEARQGRGTLKGKAGVELHISGVGRGDKDPQARMPSMFIASLLHIGRRFVAVSPHLQEKRKWEDVRPGREDGLWARQPLVFEITSPRNRVTSTPSLIRFVPQIFLRYLLWDRHLTRHGVQESVPCGSFSLK